MLRLLGTSISYCELVNRKLIPFTESHHGFQLPFYQFFSPTNNALVSQEEYNSSIRLYNSHPCEGAPKSLSAMQLRFIGSESLGNRYVISVEGTKFDYNLELNEEQKSDLAYELTTGQRWPHPPREGQEGRRTLAISGGWPTTLRSLTINPHIISTAIKRISTINNPYIGIHYRNTDMKHDIEEILSLTSEAIDQSGLSDIFLATDDVNSIPLFHDTFPNVKFHIFSDIPDHKLLGQSSIHYMSNSALEKAGLTKQKQIEDALCDILCLAKSRIFVPSTSSAMSQLAIFLRNEQKLFDNFARDFILG